MLVALVAVAVVALGYLAHRALTVMERRGWIYYRTRSRGAMGAAALFGLNEVLHPSAHTATLEQQSDERRGPRSPSPGDRPDPEGGDPLTPPDGT